jgi:ribonuclease P protein component
MINRLYRFHGYGSLRRAYQNGRTVRGQMVSLKYAPRQPGKNYRVAVVVSSKVHKSAVVRNRIRRRIYEIVRHCELIPATDYVFTVFSEQVATMESAQLEASIADLIKKVIV